MQAWIDSSVGVRRLAAGVIRVGDVDALSWLNGQITQQVATLKVGEAARYGLFVDIHGKILADAWVHRRERHVELVVPDSQADDLMAHLDKYIVMEDVELELTPLAVATAQGPRADELRDLLADSDTEVRITDRLGRGGFDLYFSDSSGLEAALAHAQALGGGALDDEAWVAARIATKTPQHGVDFGTQQLPQEAGLGARAVSFDKGCYLGQEAVCMLEMRGKPRRRLCQLEADGPLVAGASLSADDKEVGTITSSHGSRALGYVKRKALEKQLALRSGERTVQVLDVIG